MPEPSAFTGVHGTDKHKSARIFYRAGHAGNRDFTVFQRLAQHFQHIAAKFRQFIEKEHPIVCKADLAGARNRASACQPCCRDRVVRRTERPRSYYRAGTGCQPCHRIYLRTADHFFTGHIRHNRRQPPGHHRFARSRRAHNQNIVPSGRSNFKGALDILLPLHIGKVKQCVRPGGNIRLRCRSNRFFPTKVSDQFTDMINRIDRYLIGKRCFCRIFSRQEQLPDSIPSGSDCHGESAENRPYFSVEREFSDKRHIFCRNINHSFGPASAAPLRSEDTDQDGKIIDSSDFSFVCRSEIHRQPAGRKTVSAVFYGGTHALSRFLYSRIRQANNLKCRKAPGDIYLNRNRISTDPVDAEALYTRKHRNPFFQDLFFIELSYHKRAESFKPSQI